jgi:primosomal protein N'
LRDERNTYFSILYFPQEWVVVKKLDVEKPVLVGKSLQKISQRDDYITYDDQLQVTGKVKPGVEIYVNDLPAALDTDNYFATTVPLQLEKNLIKVEVFFQSEKKSWTFKVLRKIKVQVIEEKVLQEELKRAVTSEEKEKLLQASQQVEEKKEKIEALATLGVIEVTPEAEYRLNAGITRGELVTWLVKAANLTLSEVKNDLYKDIPKNHPLAPYIKAVTDLNLLKPFPDGTFRPKALVTKQEGDEIFQQYRRISP